MTNLEKLLKFLINGNDVKDLSSKTGVSEENVKSFCQDVFARIIPNDFTKAEGSHIEEKDLRGLVANFNLLLKEENLKPLMINGVRKYGLSSSEASALVSGILPLVHKKIQVLTKPKEEVKPKAVATLQEDVEAHEAITSQEKVVDEETDEIFSSISQKANEDAKKEEVVKEKKSFSFNFKKFKPQNKVEEKIEVEKVEEVDDGNLSLIEKGCIYAVLVSLVAIIIVFAVVLIKINLK